MIKSYNLCHVKYICRMCVEKLHSATIQVVAVYNLWRISIWSLHIETRPLHTCRPIQLFNWICMELLFTLFWKSHNSSHQVTNQQPRQKNCRGGGGCQREGRGSGWNLPHKWRLFYRNIWDKQQQNFQTWHASFLWATVSIVLKDYYVPNYSREVMQIIHARHNKHIHNCILDWSDP